MCRCVALGLSHRDVRDYECEKPSDAHRRIRAAKHWAWPVQPLTQIISLLVVKSSSRRFLKCFVVLDSAPFAGGAEW